MSAGRAGPRPWPLLEVLLESHKPLGAYEIMDRAAAAGPRPAPITIYRALDFLRDNGLVHRIESRNAFIACVNNHASGDLVVFLICERCGVVGEAPSAAVAEELRAAARAAGFTPKAPVIEITGVCAHCRETNP
jgi:Fur family zinc uptake transcriptional regulator